MQAPFSSSFVAKNKPVLLLNEVDDESETWPAFRKWNLCTTEGRDYLRNVHPDAIVAVEMSHDSEVFYGDQRYTEPVEMPWPQFVDLLHDALQGKPEEAWPPKTHYYLNQCTLFSSDAARREQALEPLLPQLFDDIRIPSFLPSKEAIHSANMWLSFGGTTTNLHYDCFHGLLCVIMGSKQVELYPPNQTRYVHAFVWPSLCVFCHI